MNAVSKQQAVKQPVVPINDAYYSFVCNMVQSSPCWDRLVMSCHGGKHEP